jgi:hypothetical protein
MLKTKTVLEVKVKERLYTLELHPESPLGEAYDAVTQIRGFIIDKIVEENNKSKPKEPQEKVE